MPVIILISNSWLNIPATIRGVLAYHFSFQRPGRPLYLMVPGGLVAILTGIWIFFLAKAVWVDHLRSLGSAKPELIASLVVYFVGLAIFSYTFELYNWRRAVRLTLILAVVGLAPIYVGVAIASVLRCLARMDKGKNSKSDDGRGSPAYSVGFYRETPKGAGSGPDGDILSLETCPKCGQTLSEIGGVCPYCMVKTTDFSGR
jgi:hypothetical protein